MGMTKKDQRIAELEAAIVEVVLNTDTHCWGPGNWVVDWEGQAQIHLSRSTSATLSTLYDRIEG